MMQMCEQRVVSWCCFDQGTCRGNISFEKTTFTPVDRFSAQLAIQNFNCNVALTQVTLSIEQHIAIKTEQLAVKDVIVL